ncbi:MAG: hypothetical protein JWO46_668 [Nocardioidaceae bacterium]|nr:hypothetical protein [Nocardioidaceae bacterium]
MSEEPTVYAPTDVPVIPHRAAPVGPLRHLLSVVVSVVALPLGLVALDYSLNKGLNRNIVQYRDGLPPIEALGPFAVGMLLIFVATAAGRVSGLGPLLAGVIWGAVPAAFALGAPLELTRGIRHLPHVYDAIGFGVTSYGVVIFPILAVTLIGAAVSGRWR